MKKLLLHTGLPKTGTTTIQQYLSDNREALHKQGLLYPSQEINHHKMIEEFNTSDRKYLLDSSFTHDIFRQIKTTTCSAILLSSEDISHKTAFYIAKIRELVLVWELDIEIQLIILIRYQPHWLESAYGQMVKGIKSREHRTFDAFVQHETETPFLDYFRFLTKCASLEGVKKLIVAPFPPNDQQDLTTYFAGLTGINAASASLKPVVNHVNRSLGAVETAFLRWLNLLDVSDDIFKEICSNFETKSFTVQTYSFLSYDIEKVLAEKFSEGNHKTAQMFLGTAGIWGDNLSEPPLSRNVFEQKAELEIESFHSILKALQQQTPRTIAALAADLEKFNAWSRQTQNARNVLLNHICKLTGTTPRFSEDQLKKNDSNLLLHGLSEELSLVKLINAENFFSCTNGHSSDFLNRYLLGPRGISFVCEGRDAHFFLQTNEGNHKSITMIRMKIKSSCETQLNLYYQTRQTPVFSENNKLEYNLRSGINTVYLLIDNQQFNGSVRVNPSRNPGKYSILFIEIYSNAMTYNDLFEAYEKLKIQKR